MGKGRYVARKQKIGHEFRGYGDTPEEAKVNLDKAIMRANKNKSVKTTTDAYTEKVITE